MDSERLKNIRRRAKRGARLLDAIFPGWAAKIDRERLDQSRGFFRIGDCGCILSQLDYNRKERGAGTYTNGIELVSPIVPRYDSDQARDHGFYTDSPGACEDYPLLTEAWKKQVAKRVAA